MCNDYADHVPWSAYGEAFSDIKLPVVFPKAALNLEPRDDIWPKRSADLRPTSPPDRWRSLKALDNNRPQ
jgi:hypothetical protein